MPTRHKPGPKVGLTWTGKIAGWESDIDFSIFGPTRGSASEFRTRAICFSVELLEPINGERSAKLDVSCCPPNWVKVADADGKARVANISISKKTGVEIGMVVHEDEWVALLALAISDRLASVRLSSDALFRGKAIVRSLRFSTRGVQDLRELG